LEECCVAKGVRPRKRSDAKDQRKGGKPEIHAASSRQKKKEVCEKKRSGEICRRKPAKWRGGEGRDRTFEILKVGIFQREEKKAPRKGCRGKNFVVRGEPISVAR